MLATELKQSKWDERIAPTPAEEYASLLNVLSWTEGFGLVFVQCAPSQGKELIKQVRQDLPQKRIESMNLTTEIKNLYQQVVEVGKHTNPNILFIQGLENSFIPYIKQGYGGQGDYYRLDTVPPILNHLNLQRERFRNSSQICLVFLLPLFGLKYFIQRSPDFFDWRSGLFEIAADKNIANSASKEICLAGNYNEYQRWTFSKRIKRILEIQTYLLEDVDLNTKADLYYELGALWYVNEDYEEAIAAFDRAVQIKPDKHEAWNNRGNSLFNLGHYEEAIASYDKALEINPNYAPSFYNLACFYALESKIELALENLQKAINLSPEEYLNMAKTDTDFDGIRTDRRFQALIFQMEKET